MIKKPLLLASGSHVRQKILRQACVRFEVQKPVTDEEIFKKQYVGSSQDLCLFLASKKALDVSTKHPSRWVLGADQVCLYQGRALGKPLDLTQAKKRLTLLRDQTHTLCCGVALAYDGEIVWKEQHHVIITMHAFSYAFLDLYIANNSSIVTGCAGGYDLDGEGIQMIASLEGDFFSALGLPLLPVLKAMRQHGIFPH